jgi:hypothetical protein
LVSTTPQYHILPSLFTIPGQSSSSHVECPGQVFVFVDRLTAAAGDEIVIGIKVEAVLAAAVIAVAAYTLLRVRTLREIRITTLRETPSMSLDKISLMPVFYLVESRALDA